MSEVIAKATVSLDGFIADEQDQVGPLFDWYGNGEVAYAGGDPERVFHLSPASADYMKRTWSRIGVGVIGRRLFDLTDGWGGRPAAGDHVFVVTHEAPAGWAYPDAPFTFVTDGLASAIGQAKAAAGGRDVSLTGGDLLGQALAAGLVDEVQVDLVPVVFGKGVRFFGEFGGPPALLDDPEIVQGDRVIHLRFRVRR
ncbi:dihydrofolate reductase family protein [Actinoplanes sp. NBC_00393]|uniref:dihydrofolate reductase family protein n=1 Tax=Actinoplanes sp. NBC_00393 TaxID=2975953 RepID=UPI002E21B2CC